MRFPAILAFCTSTAFAHGGGKMEIPSMYHVKPTKTEIIRVPKCPDGFIRKGGYCVRPEAVPKEDACPPGSFDDGNACVITEPGQVLCDEGVYVGNLFCEIQNDIPGNWVCPEGSFQIGEVCSIGGMVSYCPAGSAATPLGCEVIVPREFYCPPGLEDTGSLCVDTEYADTIEICPDDTELIDGMCIAVIIKDRVCPEGFANEGDDCAAFEPPLRDICPEGYIFNEMDLTCTQRILAPSAPECAEGGELVDGKCVNIIPGPWTEVCETGELIDGLCHVSSLVPPTFVCPEGYEYLHTKKGPVCSKDIAFDCSISKKECIDEPVPLPKKVHDTELKKAPQPKGKQLRKLGGKAGVQEKDGHKHGYCKFTDIVIPRTCEETVVAEPIPVCEEGVWDGRHCVIGDVFPPVKKCLGEESPHGCILIETYPPTYVCPIGFSPIGSGVECEQVDIVAPELECPEGTIPFEGRCAIFVPKECPIGGCEQTYKWPPVEVCPEEFVLVRLGKGADGKHGKEYNQHKNYAKTCIRKFYFPQETRCPDEFQPRDEETCVRFEEPVIVNEEKEIPPQFICPIGFAAVPGPMCVAISLVEATVVCSPLYDWIVDTELCAADVAPVEICPLGSHEIENECFVEVHTRPVFYDEEVLLVPLPKKTHQKKAPKAPTFKPLPKAQLPKWEKPTLKPLPKPSVKPLAKPSVKTFYKPKFSFGKLKW